MFDDKDLEEIIEKDKNESKDLIKKENLILKNYRRKY
jgi:hypothetical protein